MVEDNGFLDGLVVGSGAVLVEDCFVRYDKFFFSPFSKRLCETLLKTVTVLEPISLSLFDLYFFKLYSLFCEEGLIFKEFIKLLPVDNGWLSDEILKIIEINLRNRLKNSGVLRIVRVKFES